MQFGKSLSNQLDLLAKNLEKKMQNKTGLSGYLVETNSEDDDYDDEFNNDKDEKEEKKESQSNLIDLELVRLIKFCNDLHQKHKDTE
jgi:hypothetical protein